MYFFSSKKIADDAYNQWSRPSSNLLFSLEEAIAADNEVRVIDTFLNTKKAGAVPASILQLFLVTNL